MAESRSDSTQGLLSRAGGTAVIICAAAALGLVVITPLELRDQVILGGGVFLVSGLLNFSKSRLVTLALILISITVSTRYLFWRLTTTFTGESTLDQFFGGLLLLAELYAYLMLLLGYLQSIHPLDRKPVPLPEDVSRWPTVDVYIPTYNEPLEVVRATAFAAKALDWPQDKLRVFILDDGRRPAFRDFAAEAGVGYLTRPDNSHAKAGNLNHALKKTRGEYIAIFDCDHVPARSFLQMTMGWLVKDPRIALVQTPHLYYSPDPMERNLGTFRKLPNEGELFYFIIQKTNDLYDAAFFCGSCAVLRRTALDEVGGIAVETVTEDAHTALKMHRRGWKTAYLDVPQASGLATETLAAHVGQRIRWARGMVQIFRIDTPLLGRGLKLVQRLAYTGATVHFLHGVPRLVFLLAPLSYPLFNLHIFNALPALALAYGLPHLLHSTLTNHRNQHRFRAAFWSEVYEICLAFYVALPTTLALISPRYGKFNVTVKGGRIEEPYLSKPLLAPLIAVTGLNLLCVLVAAVRILLGRGEADVLALNAGWAVYNVVMLAAVLASGLEARQVRDAPRVSARLPAMLRLPSGATLKAQTLDLARGGVSMTVPPGGGLRPGDEVWLSLFVSSTPEVPLPALVVAQSGSVLRLRFAALDIAQEAALAQAIYSRADAWAGWVKNRPYQRPLSALRNIAAVGLFRLVPLARAAWRPAPVEKPPAPEAGLELGATLPPVPLEKTPIGRIDRGGMV